MELNPMYRLYVELNDKVNNLIKNGNSSNSGSADLSDIIVRLKGLELRPTNDGLISELSVSVKKLQNENVEMKKQLEQLGKINDLEGRVYNLEVAPKVDIKPLEDRLSKLEDDDLKAHLTILEGKIANMEQIVNAITDITYRLNEIEKRPDLNQRLNALETTMGNLNLNLTPN